MNGDRALSWGVPAGAGLLVGATAFAVEFPARTLFRTLVVGQASLLAIVVSVSLLSVQVSTARYAPLLSRLYRDGTFDRIIAKFGASILLSVALLGLPARLRTAPGPRAVAVGVAVGAAAWSFVSLLSMERRLLAFLNPEPVLDQLVEEIGFDRYREFAHSHREGGQLTRNPMLEIVQVAETSIEHRDNYSALRAVAALEDGSRAVLEGYAEGEGTGDDPRAGSGDSLHKLFDYWDHLARAAVEGGADDVLHGIVEAERDLALATLAYEGHLAVEAADALSKFCRRTAREGRLEPRYVRAQGDLLVAAVEAGRLDVAGAVVEDLRAVRAAVDDEDDADVRRHTEAVVESLSRGWATLVERSAAGSTRDAGGESVAARIETAVAECLFGAGPPPSGGRPVPAAVPAVGVAAARAGQEAVVYRVATLLLAARARSGGRYADCPSDLAAVVRAGGRSAVERAFEDARTALERDRVTDDAPADVPPGLLESVQDRLEDRVD